MNSEAYLHKVTAFVTRAGQTGTELLLLKHPFAGIQIPAGTVEENEPPELAALREVSEETGLRDLHIVRDLGTRDELPPGSTHVVLRETSVYSRPDPFSFDWARFRRGIAVSMIRQQDGYAQVKYEEGDRYPDPRYISYQIMGWVPVSCLASANRRHFYHLAFQGSSPQDWSHCSDNHTFQLFWSPLSTLPEIIPPQQSWLKYVTEELGYTFS